MELIKYKVMIYEGTVAAIHGMGSEIDEYYVPTLDMTFNFENKLTVFKGSRVDPNLEQIKVKATPNILTLVDRLYDILNQEKTVKDRKEILATQLLETLKPIETKEEKKNE